jgi:ABC-type Na+ efflux pump permease subunit
LLGAIVVSQFPGNVEIDLQSDGGAKGQGLFRTLVWGQVALILAILPALSTGALAQERERQTLQPLLLTPLSPLQIVWGKAGGVLSLVGLLLLATLPLTSLCFLLGGVSPGMLVAAYAGILGLAIFTTVSVCIVRRAGIRRRIFAVLLRIAAARTRASFGGFAAGRVVFRRVLRVFAGLRNAARFETRRTGRAG